jgi:uncharacterized membrane protein
MRPRRSLLSERLLAFSAAALVVKVNASVVASYHNYFPPNFSSDFLRGREGHFFGVYQWAFYTHIVAGPVSLVLGLVLLAERTRRRFPKWHRLLGRVQVGCVLLFVTPSGLWMAWYAAAGPLAGAGLATLAVVTAFCVALGARAAVKRRFAEHRRWMLRCYVLLCSAVVLRVIGGLATVAGFYAEWVDPLANWISWLVPLTAFEVYERGCGKDVDSPTAITRIGWLVRTHRN